MPAARPIWKGQLRLSLVSIAVEIFPATKPAAKPAFHQIHEPSGKRIRYEKVVEGVGPVDKDDIKKGYEYDRGNYVLLEDEELDAVKLETRKTLDLVQFVDESEIPPLYFDTPYFMTPVDELAEDAFRVIRDALRQTSRVGLGQLALRGKEYLVAVKPCGKGLLLETLHYEGEIKSAEPFFSDVSAQKADPELLEVATALIDKKTKAFDLGAFKDHYQAALRELIARKMKSKGRRLTVEDEEPESRGRGSNVVDLMAALKRSLDGGEDKPAAKGKPAPRAKPAAERKPAARTKPAPRKKAS